MRLGGLLAAAVCALGLFVMADVAAAQSAPDPPLTQGSPSDILLEASLGANAAPVREIVTRSRLNKDDAEDALQKLLLSGMLLPLEEGLLNISSDILVMALPQWSGLREKFLQTIEAYHRSYPLRRGIPREELKSRLKASPRVFNAVIKKLTIENSIVDYLSSVAKAGHELKFNGQEQAKVQGMMRKFEQNPYSPPGVGECQSNVGEEVLNALIEKGEFISVSAHITPPSSKG